jgi:hypothetical protein
MENARIVNKGLLRSFVALGVFSVIASLRFWSVGYFPALAVERLVSLQ